MANIAILSTAHIHTKGFLENIQKADDGRKALAIWDDLADRGKKYASDFNVSFEPDLNRILNHPNVDGFIICAENTQHRPLLEKAIPLGKPIFCEKPLATNLEDLQAIIDLQNRYQTTIFCGYFMPFEPRMRTASEIIQTGKLGQITRISFRNAHHAAYGKWFDSPDLNWFTKPKLSGGGAFMDMGTHAVHLVRSLMGTVNSVQAHITNHCGIYPEVDDYGTALLQFENGVLGRVEASWTQTGGIRGLEITGSEGTVWEQDGKLFFGKPRQPNEEITVSQQEIPNRVDRLAAIIRKEIPIEQLQADWHATVDAVRIMDACYRSSTQGQWVNTV